MNPRPLAARGLVLAVAACIGCAWANGPVARQPAPAVPAALIAHDLDSDGNDELVSLYQDQATLVVHDAAGTGEWHPSFVPLEAPADHVVPLSRGDGTVSLVVSYPTLGSVVELRRVGTAWASERIAQNQLGATQLLAADLNADGFPDLVIAAAGTSRSLQLRLGTSAGLGPPRALPLTPATRTTPSLRAADLNLDGVSDLVVGMSTGLADDPVPDHLRLFRGGPTGYLADETWYRLPAPSAVSVGQIDDDAWPDVVVFGDRGTWVLYGAGDGWLGEAERVARGRFTTGTLADLDADGRDDILALDTDRDSVVLIRPVGPRRFAPAQRIKVGGSPVALAVASLRGSPFLVTANRRSRDFSVANLHASRAPAVVTPRRNARRRSGTPP